MCLGKEFYCLKCGLIMSIGKDSPVEIYLDKCECGGMLVSARLTGNELQEKAPAYFSTTGKSLEFLEGE